MAPILKHPSTLPTSEEARAVGIKYYTLLFKENIENGSSTEAGTTFLFEKETDNESSETAQNTPLFAPGTKNENAKDVQTSNRPHIYINWEHDILFPIPLLCNDP